MIEYIEREAVIELARRNKAVCSCNADIADVVKIVNDVPTADVQPVKNGYWIINSDNFPQCSECDSEPQGLEMTDFCPNCGARMEV